MSGANQQTLTTNINWMINTYKLGPSQPAPKPNQAPAAKPTLKIYKPKSDKTFFDKGEWKIPLSKIRSYFESHQLFNSEDELRIKSLLEEKGFEKTGVENKITLAKMVVSNIPLNDCDNLLAFLDYLRLLALEEETNKWLAENIEAVFAEILMKYFVENSVPEGANPKAVRIITWRLLANLTKYKPGSEFLHENIDTVTLAAIEAFSNLKEQGSLIGAIAVTWNNLVFEEEQGDMDHGQQQELIVKLTELIPSSDNPKTRIALLNVSCHLVVQNKDLVDVVVHNNPNLITHLNALAVSENKVIKSFCEDLVLLLEKKI